MNIYDYIFIYNLLCFPDGNTSSKPHISITHSSNLHNEENQIKSFDAPLSIEALAIGTRSQKKYGVGTSHLTVKPPGPCPRCKDYRYWHWSKDCRALRCKKCKKIGHKSTRCPSKQSNHRMEGNASAFSSPSLCRLVLDI